MKYTMPREFFIPKGSTKVADKLSDAVAYLETDEARYRYGAAVFFGKQAKPVFYYTYRSPAVREQAVKQAFEGRRISLEYKAKVAAERSAYVNEFQVGDLLHTSWGYDQTNIEFFQVTEVKGRYVTLRQVASESKDTAYMQGTCKPIAGKFIGEPMRRLAQKGHVKATDGHSAWKVDPGREYHWSSYA